MTDDELIERLEVIPPDEGWFAVFDPIDEPEKQWSLWRGTEHGEFQLVDWSGKPVSNPKNDRGRRWPDDRMLRFAWLTDEEGETLLLLAQHLHNPREQWRVRCRRFVERTTQ